jgi:hypothetical protein
MISKQEKKLFVTLKRYEAATKESFPIDGMKGLEIDSK